MRKYDDQTESSDKSTGVIPGAVGVTFITVLLAIAGATSARAQNVNNDESKVPSYTLPDPLIAESGERVATAEAWTGGRRAEVLELFREHVYGRSPARPSEVRSRVVSEDTKLYGGLATRRTIEVNLSDDADGPTLEVDLVLPNGAAGPVPVFLGILIFQRSVENPSPGVPLVDYINRDSDAPPPAEGPEGINLASLPGERLGELVVKRGYGFATINPEDLSPDDKETFAQGVIGRANPSAGAGRAPDEWGALGAWAWGLSRAVDYFETDAAVEHERVIVVGHSRRGKTALWAGAQDERFAIVISNDSGCGGAALSRRRFGETVGRINTVFPHWFCENFWSYNDNEDALPVDQHMLVALSAPRPVYIASAQFDSWADPRGEFLAGVGAGPVYELFGKKGLGTDEMPAPNNPIGDAIGYHVRTGRHAMSDYDWLQYLDFADKHFGR